MCIRDRDHALEKNSLFEGIPVLGCDDDLESVVKEYNVTYGIIGIGDGYLRGKVEREILNKNLTFEFVSAIHPSVIIGKNVQLGYGLVIMAGVIINNDSKIGNHCFIATNSSVDHDSCMKNYSGISAGVTIGASVVLGEYGFIGLGASVMSGKKIGSHSVVGAGALVTKDIGSEVVAYGVPAKFIRKRNPGEKYLD